MEEFLELKKVLDRVLAKDGCPRDLSQTLDSFRAYLLEEAHEMIEAMDEKDPIKMKEELGDLLYTLIFIAKLGEKEGLFSLKESLVLIREKLIRRHPHIFGEAIATNSEEVMQHWDSVKFKEGKKTAIDGIPLTLPALSRAQKVINKLTRANCPYITKKAEDSIGGRLFELVREAEKEGVDAESALRGVCKGYEKKHRR